MVRLITCAACIRRVVGGGNGVRNGIVAENRVVVEGIEGIVARMILDPSRVSRMEDNVLDCIAGVNEI